MYLFENEFEQAKAKADSLVSKDLDKALDAYEVALEVAKRGSKDEIYALGGITAVLIRMKNFDEAKKYASKILELEPDNAWAKNQIESLSSSSKAPESAGNDITIEDEVTISPTEDVDDVIVEPLGEDELQEIKELEHEFLKDISKESMVESEEMLSNAPQPESDTGIANTIISVVGELTGISGLFRSTETIWEWVVGNDKEAYYKSVDDMYLLDFIDFIFWIGVIISVITATATGTLTTGLGGIIAGGATAIGSLLARVATKKIAIGTAIKIVFKSAGRFIAKRWYMLYRNVLFKKQHIKTFMIQMEKQGIPKAARKAVIKSFKTTGKVNAKAFRSAVKAEGTAGKFGKMSTRALDDIYHGINALSIPEKLSIINKLKLGGHMFKVMAKAPMVAGKSAVKSPFVVPEKLFLSGFKESKLTMEFLKKYQLLQLFDVGTLFTEVIADHYSKESESMWQSLGQELVELFKKVDAFKRVFASALWDFRHGDTK